MKETEVWYELVCSAKGADSWYTLGIKTDTLGAAQTRLKAYIDHVRDEDEVDYRIVKRTLVTEPVS